MIVTLAEAQAVNPSITQDALDGYEAAIRQITANPFLVDGATVRGLTIYDNEITLRETMPTWIRPNETLLLSDNGLNDNALISVESVFSQVVVVGESTLLFPGNFPAATLSLVRYPADVRAGLLKLISYDKEMGGKLGVKSETISRMSIVYYDQNEAETVGGYPAALMSPFEKYRRIKWGA